MPKISLFLNFLLAGLVAGSPALSNVTRNMNFCVSDEQSKPKRQTVVLIDASIMGEAGADGSLPFWRNELARFVNAQTSEAAVVMAPHERVSLGVVKADSTGVNIFFEGCLPLLSSDEKAELKANESNLSWFLGKGWEKKYSEGIEDFFKSAATSAVLMSRSIDQSSSSEKNTHFATSPLVDSLRNFPGVNMEDGIPRIVLITDLSKYDLPSGTRSAQINAGHMDGADAGLQLGYSELHLISEKPPKTGEAIDYLDAFFFSGRG